MGIAGPADDRLRAPDWRDKYRWPDPDQGWSGPLAGYPPDHPIRAGRPIPLHLIARKYQQDEEVTRYRAMGLIGSHIPEGTPAWTAPAGGDTPLSALDTPPLPPINTPEEKARKLAIADELGIGRASGLLRKGVGVPVTDVTESPIDVTGVTGRKVGRPKKDGAKTAAERMAAHRARMRAKKAARAE